MRPHTLPEWVAEETLATELGLPRTLLQEARERLAPEDVDRDGPWVIWKKTAATAFAAAQGLTWPPPAAPARPEEELIVTSLPREAWGGYHFPNRHIIRAKRATGEQVNVRVMDPRKFTTTLKNGAPMKFRAGQSESGPEWLLVGREPRYRGQW